jgi:hypothetical protein
MAHIAISIDAKGNLQCPDITGVLQEQITWVPDANSISSIKSITTSVGSFNPAPSSGNGWRGTIATDGPIPAGGDGLDYTIIVNARNGGTKQKSPKISIRPPEEKALSQNAETSYASDISVNAK